MGIIDCSQQIRPEGLATFNTCQQYFSNRLNLPEGGDVLAPWVAIDFVDSKLQNTKGKYDAGASVTVSNYSSDSTNPKHCAVIKSFSLGYSDGTSVNVVIHDTHGGELEEFMKHLLTDWYCLKDPQKTNFYMRIQFGWVKSGCKEPIPSARSPCYYVMVNSIETNYSEGKFIFEITGKDICHSMFEGTAQLQVGGPGDKKEYFLNAVYQFMCDPNSPPPNIPAIEFVLTNEKTKYKFDPANPPDGKNGPKIFNFDDELEGKLGRGGSWQAQGRTKLEVVRKWADSNPSKNNKSWILMYDTNDEKGKLVFYENTIVNCQNQSDEYFDKFSEGTYIVNGGTSSPVIEFNPKFKWNFAGLVGGGGNLGDINVNGMDSAGSKNPGHPCMNAKKVPGAGQITDTSPSDNQIDAGGNPTKDDAEFEAEVKKTIPIFINENISADLVIVGDPSFCPPIDAVGVRFVSIVLINPFHLVSEGSSGNKKDWLAQPACNSVLSNKGWIIKSITHKIDAGNYTTTIGVMLPAPGYHLPADQNFGGWTKGWKPTNVCDARE